MLSERHRDDAVLLDEIWDGNKPAVTSPQQLLEAIRYLEAGAPMMSTSQRDRIRAKVQFPLTASGSGASGNTVTLDAAPIPITMPISRRRLDHPILQIAATILLLLGIAGGWLAVRSNDSGTQTSPSAVVGSPSPQDQSSPTSLASLDVPRSDAAQTLTLAIRRIVLAPGAIWNLKTSNSIFADRGIVSGTVRARDDTGNASSFVGPSSFGLHDSNFVSIENIGDSDAVLIELSASSTAQLLPKGPDGSSTDLVGLTTYTTLKGQGATFILTRAVGNQIAKAGVNSSTFPAILGIIESGAFRWSADLPIVEATPGTGANFIPGSYPAGSVIESRPGGFPDLFANSDDSSILLLLARAVTPQDVAEWGVSTGISSIGESMSLDVRTVEIQPGGQFSFQMDGSVLAWGLSGTASIASDLKKDSTAVVPGLFSTVSGSTPFTISALGNQPAKFVLARVSHGPVEEIDNQATTYAQSASGSVAMPQGIIDARLSLAFSSVYSSSFLGQETEIALVTGGNFEFTAITEMSVTTGGREQILTPFSDPINLATGDSYLAEPGDSFGLVSADWESQIIKLTLTLQSPENPGSSTPVPASSTPQANVPIDVHSDECAIEPRSLDTYASIYATPYALGNGVVNHRGDTTGDPASLSQIEGITATMRQTVACGQYGSGYKVFSVYSEAQLQYLASTGQLSQESVIEAADNAHGGGITPPFTLQILIAEAEQFADGRVGAWVVSYGQISYVTFVFEDGQWLIDYWDD